MTMLDMHSHIETLESAVIEAISECEEAEKLIQPIWAA